MQTVIDQLSGMFIRPPRMNYQRDLLGPEEIEINGHIYKRTDIQLETARNLRIECSYFQPRGVNRKNPCLLYLHGNCGSRLDALEALNLVSSYGISLFCLDFSGSGLSQGEYISLGYFEKEDVRVAIEWLRKSETVSRIALWGRSMGAATAILTTAMLQNEGISCLVLDSPFESLVRVAYEFVDNIRLKIPKLIISTGVAVGLKMIRRNILKRANFDLRKVDPLAVASQCKIPALFLHAFSDILIAPHHSHHLVEEYGGDAKLFSFPGDHNSLRTAQVMEEISNFLFSEFVSQDPMNWVQSPIPVFPYSRGNEIPIRYFYCKILEDRSILPLAESSIILFLTDYGFVFYSPFSKVIIREFPIRVLKGFCFDDISFVFKHLSDDSEKMTFLYTIEGAQISKTLDHLKGSWTKNKISIDSEGNPATAEREHIPGFPMFPTNTELMLGSSLSSLGKEDMESPIDDDDEIDLTSEINSIEKNENHLHSINTINPSITPLSIERDPSDVITTTTTTTTANADSQPSDESPKITRKSSLRRTTSQSDLASSSSPLPSQNRYRRNTEIEPDGSIIKTQSIDQIDIPKRRERFANGRKSGSTFNFGRRKANSDRVATSPRLGSLPEGQSVNDTRDSTPTKSKGRLKLILPTRRSIS